MLRFCIIISLINYSFVNAKLRIVNGKDADEGEFPYAVSIRGKDYTHFCGGTILDKTHILTAAHCFCDERKNDPPYSIQYGSVKITNDDTRSIEISNISCNAAYSSANQMLDVAVLQLESAIPDGNWTAVELAKEFIPSLFSKGTIIGWGMMWDGGAITPVLQKLEVSILLDALCGLKFNTTYQLCISSLFSGACNGDSGSPLLVNGLQVGIASFITTSCEDTSVFSPNIYARVSEYFQWIEAYKEL